MSSLLTLALLFSCSTGKSRVDTISTVASIDCKLATQYISQSLHPRLRLRPVGSIAVEITTTSENQGYWRVVLWVDEAAEANLLKVNKEHGTICIQLQEIYRSQKNISVTEAAKQVKMSSISISKKDVPKLPELLREALELSIDIKVRDSIYFPNRHISFSVFKGNEEVRSTFNAPDPAADSAAFSGYSEASQPEIEAWLDNLLDALDAF